jgi:transposase
VRTKGTYLAAQYGRMAARRGAKRAAVALAHGLLVIVYALLKQQTYYHELGGSYFDERDRQAIERRLVHLLVLQSHLGGRCGNLPARRASR